MIAGIEQPDRICIIRWTGRRGLKAVALTWCASEANAGDGVVQIPDKLLDGGTILSVSTTGNLRDHRLLRVCEACKAAVRG